MNVIFENQELETRIAELKNQNESLQQENKILYIALKELNLAYQKNQSQIIELMQSNEDLTLENSKLEVRINEKSKELTESQIRLNYERERLSFILQGTNVGTWEWNIQTGETIFNERWAEMIGYHLSEISPINIDTWIKYSHPDDLKISGYLLDKHFNGESDYYEIEARMLHKNGEWIWVLDRGKVHKWDEKGRPILMSGTHQDITARKRAEESLLHSHELMSYVIEHSRSAIAVHDKNLNYIYVSQRYLLEYDVKEKDIIGKHHYEVFPDLPKKWRDVHKKALNGEISSAENDQYIHSDGRVDWTRWECRPWYLKDGTIGGIIVYTEVITERKLAEEKVREKDIQFRKLSANVPDLIFQFTRRPDGSYHVPIASVGIKNIFGCSPEDVVEDFTPIGRVIHPDDAERVINDIEYSAKHLTFFICEFRVLIPGKEVQWIYSRSTPERLPDGSVTWYGFNTNITERKLAEEILKNSEERFRSIINVSPVPMALNDDQQNITYLNPAFIHTFGYTKDDIPFISNWWNKAYPDPIYRRKVIDDWQNVLDYMKQNGTGFSPLEINIRCKDGTDKTVLISAASITNSFSGNHLVVLYDITERKKSESDLIKAKEKAEESDKLKSAFLENISHEIRSPMNGILGFSQLLSNPDLPEQERKQFSDILNKSIYKLLTIVENIITLAYLETKQLQINQILFFPYDLLNNLFSDYYEKKYTIEKSHIKLNFNNPPDNKLQINSDYTRLNQVFCILLDNAFKFTENGSIEFGYCISDDIINFFVKDTGFGIPKDKLEIVLKSFTQANKKIRQSFGGLGVGLAIAEGLITLLGGKLTIHSEVNKGTEIRFGLPLNQK